MTTKEIEKLKELEQRVDRLEKSAIRVASLDDEGEYKPEFLQELEDSLKEVNEGKGVKVGSLADLLE